jgi:hypothetical protein
LGLTRLSETPVNLEPVLLPQSCRTVQAAVSTDVAYEGNGRATRPEAAVLRGSLVGLASGVEAVTDANASQDVKIRQRPLAAALTVGAYILGGVVAALIFRGMRRTSETSAPTDA